MKNDEKQLLRRRCFAALRELTDSEKRQSSQIICDKIRSLPEFQKANTVFSFLPLASEPDLTGLLAIPKRWAFARTLNDETMEFRQLANIDEAIEGAFKILEPPADAPLLNRNEADLLLIPGVAFCAQTGSRLGRGKGHYDRYLAPFFEANSSAPHLAGICFSCQLHEIPNESHDIPMDHIVSG